MSRVIGIDLGTTNSLVSVWENGESKLIPNALGELLTPSVVNISEDETVYVGKIAKEKLLTKPDRTAAVFKRFMGSDKKYKLGNQTYKAEELSAMILRRLKEDAEVYLGEKVEKAVISVPAYFNDLARNATKNAGLIAGLEVERIINEPSAAALAYQQNTQNEEALVLVFDFGGGTLDVSLVDCFDNVVEILAVSGDNHLGGSDFDTAIAKQFLKENQLTREELSIEEYALVYEKANKVKELLSKRKAVEMSCRLRNQDYSMLLDGGKLIDISNDIFSRMSTPIYKVLQDANVSKNQVTGIVLVGGSCKMPVVQKFVQHIMGREDILVADPDHMIAKGIGVYVGIKERNEDIKDMILTDICPFSLGCAVRNNNNEEQDLFYEIIERNSPLPISKEDIFSPSHDYQKCVKVAVYQGEEYYAKDNIYLGELSVELPHLKVAENPIAIRYTYDLDGILVVDVTTIANGEKHQAVIRNEAVRLSEDDIQKKLEKLEKLKVNPRDLEQNQEILERAKLLCAQCNGQAKLEIKKRIEYFEHLLKMQDTYKMQRFYKVFHEFLIYVETQVLHYTHEKNEVDSFKTWFTSLQTNKKDQESEEAEKQYHHWVDDHNVIHFEKED